MTAPVLVVRPGRGDTGLMLAEARGGRLTVLAAPTISLPSLSPNGEPNRATSAVIGGLLGELSDTPRSVRLVLPPGTVPLRRVETVLPIRGTVDQAAISDALARSRQALGDEGRTAVLACRPTGFAVDGAWGEGDPTGRTGRALTVEATALCATLPFLARFERVLAEVGVALDGVIAPAEALAAACLEDGDGQAIHVGYGATLAISAVGGAVTHQASVPLGRRHLEQDVAEAAALEADAARLTVTEVLAGRTGEHAAQAAVDARLGELRDLLQAARAAADFREDNRALVSGVPPEALGGRGVACGPSHDPLLLGGARLALGLGGEVDQPALPRGGGRRGVFSWLRAHF